VYTVNAVGTKLVLKGFTVFGSRVTVSFSKRNVPYKDN